MTELQRNLSAAGAAAAARLAILAASRVAVLNTIVTNVPGSREPIYLAGCRQRLSVPVVALVAGLGLMHIVSSYDGELQISFIVDARAMPDSEHYEVLLLESLRALESA